jgi:preprotein translocase subunit SecF
MPLTLIPAGTKFDFLKVRTLALGVSLAVLLVSVFAFLHQGLSYGIDFRGGILLEIRTQGPADLAHLRSTLSGLNLGGVELQEFGAPDNILIRVERQQGDEKAQAAAVQTIKDTLGAGIEYRRIEFVGPKVGQELIRAGVLATLLALGAIMVYIWFRFEWQFGVSGIVALLHDVVTTIGLYSVFHIEFNLTSVAAILTIAGYSINDTVVVFDRVRENMRKYKSMPLIRLLNLTVNETLSRTILTSSTTMIAVLMLFFFGGEVIHGFSLAMIWGILIGTYSSIWVASALLIYFGVKRSTVVREDSPAGAATAQSR